MTQAASYNLPHVPTFSLGVMADNPKGSDFALAQAASRGAMAAIGELYARHRPRVYALCLRMTHNVADAEDLTQEVFVHLMRKAGSFRGESLFTTWLHHLTVNHVLKHFRREAVRKVDKLTEIEADLSSSLKSRHSTHTWIVDNISLGTALSQLPPGCRTVFVLFDVEGYCHEEVAGILGCAVGTSKAQLHKARRKLRRLLNTGGRENNPRRPGVSKRSRPVRYGFSACDDDRPGHPVRHRHKAKGNCHESLHANLPG